MLPSVLGFEASRLRFSRLCELATRVELANRRTARPCVRLLVTAMLASSLSLAAGEPAVSSRRASAPEPSPLGLPAMPRAERGPLAQARVALGRKLFMDRRLSLNGTMSCGMCHVPEQGFAVNELTNAVGMQGRSLRRNAPTVLNVGFAKFLFHDGRETALEKQLWGPLLAPDEMANGTREKVVALLGTLPDYRDFFERAFPQEGISVAGIESALAAYERSLVSANSRFDRWHFGGERSALSPEEKLGFQVFAGRGRCVSCHRIGEKDALFTDDAFHNTGVGWARAKAPAGSFRVPLAPGIETQLTTDDIASLVNPLVPDDGRFEVTGQEQDRWAYRTPSLRNVALTAPFMHDGSLPTLEAVIEFYDRGGIDNPGKDPLLSPLSLTKDEKQALVAFLKTLTGDNVRQLAAQARAAADLPKDPDGPAPRARND